MKKVIYIEKCNDCPLLWDKVRFSGEICHNFCKNLKRSIVDYPTTEIIIIPEDCPLENYTD